MKDALKSLLRSHLFDGILLIATGLLIFIFPGTALTVLCAVVGALLIISGLANIITAFFFREASVDFLDLICGLLQLAVGILVIAKSDVFINLFETLIGFFLLICAVPFLIFACRIRQDLNRTKEFWLSLIALFAVTVLAILIIIKPAAFASFTVRLEGISLIIEGLGIIFVIGRASYLTKKKL